MEILKLHADGANKHLEALKKQYTNRIEKLNTEINLFEFKKSAKLKEIDEWFVTEKKQLRNKLF